MALAAPRVLDNLKQNIVMNNYIKPTTKVIAVSTQQMIAGSLETKTGEAEEWGAKGNGGMLWDDDEDYPSGVPGYNIWEE